MNKKKYIFYWSDDQPNYTYNNQPNKVYLKQKGINVSIQVSNYSPAFFLAFPQYST